ncbi:hypothetical protein MKS88_000447 [Plasmodium brasilianum]|uniref:Uncharacterized protein n=2 Tax=Plasmodium (Plasmodium) TaxID=418103 RepID=A0A1A8WPH9_PLAMA|nr:conserved Plasmodium protein, unknown function [Plasmodium malariae]KAI4841210.1 hypothetical protein MKS88_000447 [Plasmodium brasilianum]SBS93766.1 conserved Plasmodium protein, unknown function [Plasmodium malariae]SBT86894.1 conserved Plasmodium protein, unknown function [Plasmodium malariae]
MAYHLFKKLQRVSSKDSKPKNENKNEDINKWLKNIQDILSKNVVDNDSNESVDDNVINITDYLITINNIVKYTEQVKNRKIDYFDDENTVILLIKQFCKILNIIHVFEKLKRVDNVDHDDDGNKDDIKKKITILTKNNVWTLLEEIILNSSEVLNKIICLNKDMFHKKNIRIDCNKLKTYVNYLNTLFKETNNCDLLFSIFYFDFENSIFIIYELILLLQKIYIYDNINFYFYLYDNIIYCENTKSAYYYNLYSLKCFQILYHEHYSESNINAKEQNNFAQKIHEQYMLIISNLRKNKLHYVNYLNYPLNYSEDKLIYKNKNENYYINEQKEFNSISTNKKFRSFIFFDAEDEAIQKNLKKLEYTKRLYEFLVEYDSYSSSSLSSDVNVDTYNSVSRISGRNKGNKTEKDKKKNTSVELSSGYDYSTSSFVHNYGSGEKNGSKENKSKNSNLDNFENQSNTSNSSFENKNNESYCYCSSDISSNFITVDEEYEEYEEEKKKINKNNKVKYCEENIFLIMYRNNKVQNVRNNIDRLILNKGNFICKLLGIIASNEDAYLINEILVLFLLVSENNIEIKNIITYERIIETIIKIMKEEHYYLFKQIRELFFLYDDDKLDMCYVTKVCNFSNKGREQEKERGEKKNLSISCNIKREEQEDKFTLSHCKRNVEDPVDYPDKCEGKSTAIANAVDEFNMQGGSNGRSMSSLSKINSTEGSATSSGVPTSAVGVSAIGIGVVDQREKYGYSYTEGNIDKACIFHFTKCERSTNNNLEDDKNQMEIYLDNISINIDIKSSLLLLKCLIINSEFGPKYIFELNILEEFICVILNLYNIIIYVYNKSMLKYYNNSIFIITIFLDVLCCICKFRHKNSSSDVSLKQYFPIFQRAKFLECSFFFFFKFVYIYLYKDMVNSSRSRKRRSPLMRMNNEEENTQIKNEPLSNYEGMNESKIVDLNCVKNGNLHNDCNEEVRINVVSSAHLNSSNASSVHLNSNNARSVLLSSNNTSSKQFNMKKKGSSSSRNSSSSSRNIFKENEQIFEVFKNTNFVDLFNICCKFLFQDEQHCACFLLSSYSDNSTNGSSNANNGRNDNANNDGNNNNSRSYHFRNSSKKREEFDVHIEECNFIMACFRKDKYFYLEHVLTFYLKRLKQVKYIDMLLILFLYDKQYVIRKCIYEFFMCLCEKYVDISNYLNTVFFFEKSVFYYYIMHKIGRLKKSLYKIKKWHKNRSSNMVQDNSVSSKKIERREKFFLKYIACIKFIYQVLSLVTVHSNNSEKEEDNTIISNLYNFLKSVDLNFEEIIYYNMLYVHGYKGTGMYYIKKLNNESVKNILILQINMLLYRNRINNERHNFKYLINVINSKYLSKRMKCLICVYISIYLFLSKEERVKKELIKTIMEHDIFNIIYKLLNDFCKYNFFSKKFSCSTFVKCKDVYANIKNISEMKRKKYFFFYSTEKSLFFIHFIYSKLVHHDMLTYFFKQTKNHLTSLNHSLSSDKIYSKKKKSRSLEKSSKASISQRRGVFTHKGINRKFSSGENYIEVDPYLEESEDEEEDDDECKYSEEDSTSQYIEGLDSKGGSREVIRKVMGEVSGGGGKGRSQGISSGFSSGISAGISEYRSGVDSEEANIQRGEERKGRYLIRARLNNEGGKEDKNEQIKERKDRKGRNGAYHSRYYYDKKNTSEKKIRKGIIKEDIILMRNKLNEQELKHIEEKIYLNKIIEKKNDIINNILYSYLLLKEKLKKTEDENIVVKNTFSLWEKEQQVINSTDMNELQKDYIHLLKKFEKTNTEKTDLEGNIEKLIDLLIYLYDNVKGCRQYMQNLEDINLFKNKIRNEEHQPHNQYALPNDQQNHERVERNTYKGVNKEMNKEENRLNHVDVSVEENARVYNQFYVDSSQEMCAKENGAANRHMNDEVHATANQDMYAEAHAHANKNTYTEAYAPANQDMYIEAHTPTNQDMYAEVHAPVNQDMYIEAHTPTNQDMYAEVHAASQQQMYNELYFDTNRQKQNRISVISNRQVYNQIHLGENEEKHSPWYIDTRKHANHNIYTSASEQKNISVTSEINICANDERGKANDLNDVEETKQMHNSELADSHINEEFTK